MGRYRISKRDHGEARWRRFNMEGVVCTGLALLGNKGGGVRTPMRNCHPWPTNMLLLLLPLFQLIYIAGHYEGLVIGNQSPSPLASLSSEKKSQHPLGSILHIPPFFPSLSACSSVYIIVILFPLGDKNRISRTFSTIIEYIFHLAFFFVLLPFPFLPSSCQSSS